MDPDTPERRSGKRWSVLLAAVVAVVAVGGIGTASWWSGPHAGPTAESAVAAPAGSPKQMTFACIGSSSDPDSAGTCERRRRDYQARRPLTAEQHTQADIAGRKVLVTLPPIPPGPTVCDRQVCSIRPGTIDQAQVDAVRAAMIKANFSNVVVRLAWADDPAPQGSLLYGVPVGAGCVLGYQNGAGGSRWVAGPLADDGCLPR
jgi:hypothetical protein